MQQNIDEVMGTINLVDYKNLVWRKFDSTMSFKDKIEQWLRNPANRSTSNAFAVVSAHQLGKEIPHLQPNPKAELRHYLTEIKTKIDGLLHVMTDIWQPLHPSVESQPSTKKKRFSRDAKDRHARLFAAYDIYRKNGTVHKMAINKLVHDFRLEYNPSDAKSVLGGMSNPLQHNLNISQIQPISRR